MKKIYSYKNQDFDTKEEMIEAYQADYKKGIKDREEDQIRKLTIKKLKSETRKNIIWIIVTILTLVLAVISIILQSK